VHDDAISLEGVGAEQILEEGHHLGEIRIVGTDALRDAGGIVVADRHTACHAGVLDVPVPDGQRHQVGGQGVVLLPQPGARAVPLLHGAQDAVRRHLPRLGHGDAEGVGGLVGGVVVHRVPGGSAGRLAGHEDGIVVRVPAEGVAIVAAGAVRAGVAGVGHGDGEGLPAGERLLRDEDEFPASERRPAGAAVHRRRRDVRPLVVEVQAGQARQRLRVDRRRAGDLVAAHVDGQIERVVGDVIAPVAHQGEVRVADARRADRSAGGGGRLRR